MDNFLFFVAGLMIKNWQAFWIGFTLGYFLSVTSGIIGIYFYNKFKKGKK